MSVYGKLAAAAGNNGIAVAAYQVFFVDEGSAQLCAQKYGGTVETLDDGFLVNKTPAPVSDNDPILQAIKKAVEEFKAKSN